MLKSKQFSNKIVLLGDPNVGKTSVARKFVYDIFDDIYISTLGTKISKKQIVYNNLIQDCTINLTMLVWDVMGQHDFSKYHEVAFTGCKGALIVSDITREETIKNIQYWQDSVFKSEGKIPFVIIGNKNDLANEHQEGIQKFNTAAEYFNVPAFLTSAKTGENVEMAFFKLGEKVLNRDFDKIQ